MTQTNAVLFVERVKVLLADRAKFRELADRAANADDVRAETEAQRAISELAFGPLGIIDFSEVTMEQLQDASFKARLLELGGSLDDVLAARLNEGGQT